MNLNEQQKKAIEHFKGPCLVIGTPGSGKTRVITERVRYLVEEKGVKNTNILVITFTKAAAVQMKKRYESMMGDASKRVYFGTFHAIFFTILKYAYHYTADNIIRDDTKRQILKELINKEDIEIQDENDFLNDIEGEISRVKGEMIELQHYYSPNCPGESFRRIFTGYQKALQGRKLIDFDDMLVYCYELLKAREDIRQMWHKQYPYILIDEFQDINKVQYDIVKMLAAPENNLFIVGDDDQSIYKFRGANIYNILNFEKHFPNARVIKLEQNYRSTQTILDAANGVIKNNEGRKEKALWTENGTGDKIDFEQFDTAYEEADYIARDIRKKVEAGNYQYKDCAILYRTNAQSRLFEERFVISGIPYKIVGGVNFYARKEIKDLLCYLKTIDNARDDLAVRRIINVPKRGIGATTLNRVQEYADAHDISFYNALRGAEEITTLGRAASKIKPFVMFIQSMRSKAEILGVSELLRDIIEQTGYVTELEAEDTEEAKARIENIDELISKAAAYEDACEENGEPASLSGFLEEVALVADIDSLDEDQDYVILMTLHSAKGLEFPQVYLAGMEDGLFPSYMSIVADDAAAELEEERRLAYVGITRAKQNLAITCAKQRMVRGETQYNKVSRFVKEIPRELLSGAVRKEKEHKEPKAATYQQAKQIFRAKPYGMQAKPEKSFGTPGNPASLGYQEGDRVRHMKFGEGTVQNIVQGGRDYEVTVNFDKVGVKKMFASFAKLKKV